MARARARAGARARARVRVRVRVRVRDDERVTWLRTERLSDTVLVLLECRLVLQVGLARREAAGLGVEVEGAMDARVGVRVLL